MNLASLAQRLVPAVMFASAAACSYHAAPETGSVEVIAAVRSASTGTDPGDIDHVTLTVSCSTLAPSACTGHAAITQTLAQVGSKWVGTLGAIPVGSWDFSAVAQNSANVTLYSGGTSTPVPIAAGGSPSVTLVLQQTAPATPFTNQAPVITSLYVSTTNPAPDEDVIFTAAASDPDGDALTFDWSQALALGGINGGPGTFDAASPLHGDFTSCTGGACTIRWKAPDLDSDQTLSFVATDTKLALAGISVDIHTRAANATGSAAVSATVNTYPVVDGDVGGVTQGLTASPTLIAADSPATAANVTVLAIVASDADGDALHYTWSADPGTCTGTFSSAGVPFTGETTLTTPTFTIATVVADTCTIEVLVDDHHLGTNTASLTLQVGTPPPAHQAPVVDTSFQSVLSYAPGDPDVQLSLATHDPDGAAIDSIVWTANAGTLAASATTDLGASPATSSTTWSSTTCTDAIITATITSGADVTAQTFSIACTITTGLSAYFPFDGAGSDSTGHASAFNTSAYSSGKLGQAARITGSGMLSSGLIAGCGTGDCTVQVWFNAVSGGSIVDARASGGPLLSLECWITPQFLTLDASLDPFTTAAPSPATTNTWHHLVGRRLSGAYSVWLDGVSTAGVTSSTDLGSSYADIELGTGFTGLVDDLAFWTRALSDTEIAYLYNGGDGRAVQ